MSEDKMNDEGKAGDELRDSDKAEWVSSMSEHVKKLGVEEALHDYVKTLRIQS